MGIVDYQRAALGGIAGAAAMAVVMMVARLLGMPIALELYMGSFFTGGLSTGAWVAGFAVQLGTGALFGLAYGVIFEKILHRAGRAVGAGLGALHGVAAGLALLLVPPTHPLVPEPLPAPGAFYASLGVLGIAAFVGIHLVFGAVVGSVYAPARTREERREAHA